MPTNWTEHRAGFIEPPPGSAYATRVRRAWTSGVSGRVRQCSAGGCVIAGGLMLEIGILGPLVVRRDGRTITPTARKPRTVLAMLAMRAGEPVPVKELVDELWG